MILTVCVGKDEILGSHLPPRMDQMPSTEHESGSIVGVGSLPGGHDETDVALTPEERLHPEGSHFLLSCVPSSHSPLSDEIFSGHPSGRTTRQKSKERQPVEIEMKHLTHKQQRERERLAHLSPEELERRENMPTTEHISTSRVGVGSLPGKRSEQGVALTPEERLHPAGMSLRF